MTRLAEDYQAMLDWKERALKAEAENTRSQALPTLVEGETVRWVLPENDLPPSHYRVRCAIEEGEGSGWVHPTKGNTYHTLDRCYIQDGVWWYEAHNEWKPLPAECIVRMWLYVPADPTPTFALHEQLSSLPSLLVESKQQEWIKVEDRLPEPTPAAAASSLSSNEVLTLSEGGIYKIARYGNRWGDWNDGTGFGFPFKVTHWQPLPALPTAPKQKGNSHA